ncbi:MAG: M23 family metallopeptidase [Dinghuibacter sp.]|nr:M23 family metallopeptidase [Dinghuibacter sp.]
MHTCKYCALVFAALWLAGCGSVRQAPAEINRSTARGLQKQRFSEDTSFVYWLPWRENGKHLVVQGYYSPYSHKTDVALDFKLKTGTTICAARGGVVYDLFEDSNVGGAKDEYLDDGNYIMIRHPDGSKGYYWHLKYQGVLVNIGDTVKQGQPIGLSGNTGYSAFPHLHFEVWGTTATGQYTQLPVRFQTRKGPRYLRPLRYYTAIHE